MITEQYTEAQIEEMKTFSRNERRQMSKYCSDNTSPLSKELEELAKETNEKAEDPGMMIGHLEGHFLRLLLKMIKAKRVLEIGTFTGYSALVFAEGLPDDGEVVTIDVSDKYQHIRNKYWNQNPHGNKITQLIGPGTEMIPQLKGNFDFIFIDADKSNNETYLEMTYDKLNQAGIIAIDNAFAGGKVLNPPSERVQNMVNFSKKLAADTRFDTVMLPVRDGIILAMKK